MANIIDGPKGIKINMVPGNVERYRKGPIVLFLIIFTALIVYLIMNIDDKEPVNENTQKIVSDDPRVDDNKSSWYNDIKFNSSNLQNKKEVPVETKEVFDSKIISTEEKKFIQQSIEEEYKRKADISVMESRQLVDNKRAELDAYKANLDINVDEDPRLKDNSAVNTDNSVNNLRYTNIPAEIMASAVPLSTGDKDINDQDRKIAFLNDGITDGFYLSHIKEKQLSKYEIKAGSTISAALITGLNSDLPGSAIAQVTENVYDSVTGNYLLIPQGSKLIGKYDSKVSYGQNRALVVWNRLLFPDGSSINLEMMQGVDGSGYAGFNDKLDRHLLQTYSNALLLSLVGAGYEMLNPGSSAENSENSVAGSIGQQLAEVSSQLTRNNIDVQPTIKIRPGYKFKVMVMKDMVLEDFNNAS
ncbi:MAG: conjugal transfer protein TrbI [Candidatus Omnitrophica bacterium]|nr:conjugal transfer protein TrbI [Candidatus Omnitrophota bacterium]